MTKTFMNGKVDATMIFMLIKLSWLKQPLIKNVFIIFASLILFLGGGFLIWLSNLQTPNLESFAERRISQSTKIYDKTGKILLYDLYKDARRTVIPYTEISHNIKNATVAIEDDTFYEHRGVRPLAFLRALLANLKTGSFGQGGSTITQQVVKNTLLTNDKSIARKFKEWILAVRLEKKYTKEEILASYLNESPYGGNIYGVEEASESYFGKHASLVSVAEAAYLAALPQAPTYYSPYGNHRSALDSRKNLVLQKMLENKFISQEDYTAAKSEKVGFLPEQAGGIKAPHFVFFVKEELEKKYGDTAIQDAGFKVITTLDYSLQQKAEEIVKRYALENEKNFNATNAALVTLDVKTGGILTMVGSRDYFDTNVDGNFNVSIAYRQPGSSFKPFVYATAFKKGYTPDTVVFDLQTEFSTFCNPDGTPIKVGDDDKCYMPENYDGLFKGPIKLRNALAESRNIPAIKTLYLSGLTDSLQTAKDMGITSLTDVNRYGLTLVLGGGEVSLLELTSAYSGFAGEGVHAPYRAIERVEDTNGDVVDDFPPTPQRALPTNIARQITDILSDEEARMPEFGRGSWLYFGNHDVADKTGTTNDYRDAWIIGYTPSVSVGAWAGNNDNSPMEKKIAGFIVAPLWHEFMVELIKTLPPDEHFVKPEEVDQSTLRPVLRGFWQGSQLYTIDKISGKLATEYTPPELRQDKVVQNVHSILYWVDKDNPNGPPPEHPENDSQFNLWEYAVQKWVSANNIQNETTAVIPSGNDDVHLPQYAPTVSILSPSPNTTYDKDARILVSVNSAGKFPISKIDIFLNDHYLGSARSPNLNYSFVPSATTDIATNNQLKVIVYDMVLNHSEASVPLKISF